MSHKSIFDSLARALGFHPDQSIAPTPEEMIHAEINVPVTAIGNSIINNCTTGFTDCLEIGRRVCKEEKMKLLTCLEKLKSIYPEIVIGDFSEEKCEMISKLKIDRAIESEKRDLNILEKTDPPKLKAWNSIVFSLIEAEEEYVDGERYQFIIFMHDNEDGEDIKIPFYVEDGHHSAPLSKYVVPYDLKNEFVCLEMGE